MSREAETISVTELWERTHEILETVHFGNRKYMAVGASQEMAVILDVDEYTWLFGISAAACTGHSAATS
jgi:hypothetical protein